MQISFIGFAVTSLFLTFAWIDMIYMLAAYLGGLYVAIDEKLRRHGCPIQPQVSKRRQRGAGTAGGFIGAPQ